MGTLIQDVRYGFRMLVRSPSFTIVTVLTLALGIGATTAIFSMVNSVLLRPLAYPESGRLVYLHEFIPAVAEKFPILPVSARHFIEWRQRCLSFESLSLIDPGTVNLTERGEPETLEVVRVSASLFETLGVQPVLGRAFVAKEEEDGRNRVVVISDGLWRRRFNADPTIIGATVRLDNEAYTVIGVLPGRFRFPNPDPFGAPELMTSSRPDLFTPKVFSAAEREELMGMYNFAVIARLKDSVTQDEALAELNVIGAQLVKMAGEDIELRAVVKPLKDAIVEDSQHGLLVVLSAVGSVLLIACLNLAILHLVRAERRSFDSSIRMALGAKPLQLLRQALMETVMLAVLGATLGVVVASAGLSTLIRIAPADIPRLDEVRVDGNVLLFALGLTGVTTLLCGLLPAWRTARSHTEQVLRAGGRTATASVAGARLRSALVTAEVGLGVMLLIAAGLFLSSFMRIMRTDKGFHAPTVLATDITLPGGKYGSYEQKRDFHKRLLEHLASAPGVHSAAIVSALPLEGETWITSAWVAGDARPRVQHPIVNVRFVSADYFQTMGIPLLAGRSFDDRDGVRKVAVISERLARTLWPAQDVVVGRRFLHEGEQDYEVIGVAKDVRANADREAVAMVYRPSWEGTPARTVVVARTTGDPFSIAGSVRAAVRSTDADVPISTMRTMRQVLEESVSQRRFQALLVSAFAICALVLAGLGIYGVVSYSVTRRTREIGIRMAFGATPLALYRLVLQQGMAPVGVGLLAGVAGAFAAGRLLRSLLYQISPHDPLTILAVAVVISMVSVAACYIPARRAAKVDPMVALRYE